MILPGAHCETWLLIKNEKAVQTDAILLLINKKADSSVLTVTAWKLGSKSVSDGRCLYLTVWLLFILLSLPNSHVELASVNPRFQAHSHTQGTRRFKAFSVLTQRYLKLLSRCKFATWIHCCSSSACQYLPRSPVPLFAVLLYLNKSKPDGHLRHPAAGELPRSKDVWLIKTVSPSLLAWFFYPRNLITPNPQNRPPWVKFSASSNDFWVLWSSFQVMVRRPSFLPSSSHHSSTDLTTKEKTTWALTIPFLSGHELSTFMLVDHQHVGRRIRPSGWLSVSTNTKSTTPN